MTVAHPAVLLLVIVVAFAFVLAYRAIEARATRSTLAYSDLAFAEAAFKSRVPWATVLLAAWTFALLAVGTALAGPRFDARVPVSDGSVMLCVDTSGSMASTDIAPSRGEAAKSAVRAFIDGTSGATRIGIVSFSNFANLVAALGDDRAALHDAVDRIPPPNGGTAIGEALAAAAQSLPDRGHRAIVLITDGVNNTGRDPLAIAQAIGARGITIYTIGIGTNNSGELIPGTNEEAQIDEDALRAFADAAHGDYARVSDAGGLRSKLAALARSSIWEKKHVDASLGFAVGGGVLMIAALFGSLTFGRIP